MKLNKQKLQQNIVRLGFFGGIPVLVGLASMINSGKFWPAYLICIFVEIMGLYYLGSFVRIKSAEKVRMLELEKISNLSAILGCAACNAANAITFIPDDRERVEFSCQKCNKTNVVTIHFSVAVVAAPQDSLTIPTKTIA